MPFRLQSSAPSANGPIFSSEDPLAIPNHWRACVRVNPQSLVDPRSKNFEERQVILTVMRKENFPLFISNVIEVMRPLNLQSGGVPLRVLRVPVNGHRKRVPIYVSDSSKMDVQEITYFTHALDGFLIAEQLEVMWNFSLFARGVPIPLINETARKNIMSLGGQIEVSKLASMPFSWTERHWIKFFYTFVTLISHRLQGLSSITFSPLPIKNSEPILAFSQVLGPPCTSEGPELPPNIANPSSFPGIPYPRSATDAEKVHLNVSASRSYSKLDEPLPATRLRKTIVPRRGKSHSSAREHPKAIDLPISTRNSMLRLPIRSKGTNPRSVVSPKGTFTLGRHMDRRSTKGKNIENHTIRKRPANVYGRDRRNSLFKRTHITNHVWINPELSSYIALTSKDGDSVKDVTSAKKFVIDPPSSDNHGELWKAPRLMPQGYRPLTYGQKLHTVNRLNDLVHVRGEDIFALLRSRCPELLRQSKAMGSINLTRVPDVVFRQLYQHIVLRGPVEVEPLTIVPDLAELSDEEMEFLWNEYPRLGVDEQHELSRIIDAVAPNVQYGIVENSVPLARKLPVAVQHFILKYVKDRKAQFDEVVADAEEYLEKQAQAEQEENSQKIKQLADAVQADQMNVETQEFENDIWNQREAALREVPGFALANRDILFGSPRTRRRPGRNSALGEAQQRISATLPFRNRGTIPERKS